MGTNIITYTISTSNDYANIQTIAEYNIVTLKVLQYESETDTTVNTSIFKYMNVSESRLLEDIRRCMIGMEEAFETYKKFNNPVEYTKPIYLSRTRSIIFHLDVGMEAPSISSWDSFGDSNITIIDSKFGSVKIYIDPTADKLIPFIKNKKGD